MTSTDDIGFMRAALRLARRGFGETSPNPMVGALLVKQKQIIGSGWHRRAGEPHAEIEALRDAQAKGRPSRGATLYVTLEPCSTHGRTPPCTDAILRSEVRRVVVGATDPNPPHAGQGYEILRRHGITVVAGVLEQEAEALNPAFNYWIVQQKPFVTLKAAMTLDGKIATSSGESKWITAPNSRRWAMRLRQETDAVLVGINTARRDDPSLTLRGRRSLRKRLRVVLDSRAEIPLGSKLIEDQSQSPTIVVVTDRAPAKRISALEKKAVQVWRSPQKCGRIDLTWLMDELGKASVTHLLVEGGGETNAAFFANGLVQRVVFFYAPKIFGGAGAPKAVAGLGATRREEILRLTDLNWRQIGPDLLLTARVSGRDNYVHGNC